MSIADVFLNDPHAPKPTQPNTLARSLPGQAAESKYRIQHGPDKAIFASGGQVGITLNVPQSTGAKYARADQVSLYLAGS